MLCCVSQSMCPSEAVSVEMEVGGRGQNMEGLMHPHPRIFSGWPCYLGIPGYLDRGEGIRLSIL